MKEPNIQKIQATYSTEGMTETIIPFLSIIRFSEAMKLRQGILKPSFCFILQGKKKILIGKETIHYGVGDYLVSTIDIPTSGNVVGATKINPYLGVRIELDAKEIASIVMEANLTIQNSKKAVTGAFVLKADPELKEAIYKLLNLLEKPKDAAFLASSLKREIIYRMLTGKDGHLLYQNIIMDNQQAGIGKAINWIKDNFDKPIVVKKLAKSVNMSVSSLQHKFKAVTTMGLLQYQKQLRLLEARRLLLAGDADASTAAYQVGYESHSQFTREYKRLFGAPPIQDVKMLSNGDSNESHQSDLH